MDALNVESYVRCNYGRYGLVIYRAVKKFYLRIESVKLDLYYLKSCRSNDIMPTFLWFKTANHNLRVSPEYTASQKRLLNAEIKYKHQHLRNLKKSYQESISTLQTLCPNDIIQRLHEIITTICKSVIVKKKQTIEKKLNKLGFVKEPKNVLDRSRVITDLTNNKVSPDQLDVLAHGLDYSLLPKQFDTLNAVGNIEKFFHSITDIFQYQKKIMADMKEKDQVVRNDIRVLDPKQLTLAGRLHNLTESFRVQANQYQREQHQMKAEQLKYHRMLQDLRKDDSIIITRPDKGRGVVILEKADYISKMNVILNDTTKFECLTRDITISRELTLTTLLRKLKKKGQISEQFYDMARPSGSNPGRLYGLPKIHKKDQGIPLRPVLSSIGAYNYGLAKALKLILSSMIENTTTIKNSATFINELQSLPSSASSYKMVSFDITSLYTNIPIDETIGIILDYLYNDALQRSEIKREDMKRLLEYATKETHFMFNGKLYNQKDGVSMGSPLAPLLAEIFLQNFEKKHLPAFKEKGIMYWKRYVDDTFVLLDPEVTSDDICAQLSQCHPSLKFTVEEERSGSHTIPFLEVLVQRQPGIGFRTRVYRKSTFTGLLTKWDSFVPKKYKLNAISIMVYRAIKICSTDKALHNEFNFIRKTALKNGYPLHVIQSTIKKQLDLKNKPRPPKITEPEEDITILRVPYYGKPSHIYAKRVVAAVHKQYPLKKIRVVYDVTSRIGQNFNSKDKIPTELKAGVVYEATCSQCGNKYIGKTCRHLKTRIYEHLYDQKQIFSQPRKTENPVTSRKILSHNALIKHKDNHASQPETNQTKVPKKQRKKATATGNVIATNPDHHQSVIDSILTTAIPVNKPTDSPTAKSALAKHYVQTGHQFNENDFKIILSEKNRFRLLIKESLIINERKPKLNRTVRSLPLYIYPTGMSTNQHNSSSTRPKPIRTGKYFHKILT